MKMLAGTMARFIREESGASAIEYALIGTLVAVAAIAGITMVGGGVSNLFNFVSTRTNNAVGS